MRDEDFMKNNSIIKLNKFGHNLVSNRHVLIMNEPIDIIYYDCDVKIGSPVQYQAG